VKAVPERSIVDLHVHLFPQRLAEAIWKYFETRSWPVHHEHLDQVVATLASHGVEIACALAYPHRRGVARQLNQFMESVAQRYPMFRPFGSVHVEDPDIDTDVEHVIGSTYLHGFKFQPLVQCFDINDPRLDHLYARCSESGTPLIMHVGNAPYANPFVGFSHFSRLMGRFPDLRVCVSHMGAFEYDEFLRLLDDYPGVYLDTTMINVKTHLFDTVWRGDPERLLRHRDRVCFGSDWPHVPYPYGEALASVARFPLPEDARDLLLRDNARRFLGLDAQ
jgi:predicted TIM-barrel fold metal-dependent hydrolase